MEPTEGTQPQEKNNEAPAATYTTPLSRPPIDAEPILPISSPTFEQRKVIGHGNDAMLVVSRSRNRAFLPDELGESLRATEEADAPQTPMGRLFNRTKRLLVGRPLATDQAIHERLTKVKALAVLSSDAISSVAYATEASLGVLILAGTGYLQQNLTISFFIIALMIVVGISYRQTIHAYPNGGGSYIVAKDNLGMWPGLIAAAALLIDYVLTVSVSVSAGIDALVSAVQGLSPYSVLMGVVCTVIIMLVNLRGVRDSGTIFAVPTYLFIFGFLLMIFVGVIHAFLSPGGLFTPVPPTGDLVKLGWTTTEKFGMLLVLKAFASGCSAMTGVEAISNGVPAFQKPEWKNAQQTLTWMVATLVTLFLGTSFLAWRFGIMPLASGSPTVTSQIASKLFVGAPWVGIYFYIQITTLLILVLAANTSYADFPRLASILSRDKFLPSQFSFRGDRLSFSIGIVVLSLLAIVLQVGFKGNTSLLINLYALGVFTAFTLSQSGMVVHWWRLRGQVDNGWQRSMVINGIGATATALVTVVIGISKFWGTETIAHIGKFQLKDGAWIVLILIPLLVLMFFQIHRHYTRASTLAASFTPLSSEGLHHVVIVPISSLNVPALQGLAYGRSITPNVYAVHIVGEDDDTATMKEAWKKYVAARKVSWARQAQVRAEELAGRPGAKYDIDATKNGPQLVIINSPYRSLVAPLVAYIRTIRDLNPHATVTVILPEYVPAHLWEGLLHNQSALRLKWALYREPRVVVVNIPYHLANAIEPVSTSVHVAR